MFYRFYRAGLRLQYQQRLQSQRGAASLHKSLGTDIGYVDELGEIETHGEADKLHLLDRRKGE